MVALNSRWATNFKEHITNKVERKGSEVLVPRHPQVGRKTLNPCIGDYEIAYQYRSTQSSKIELPTIAAVQE
jgi:hypothetical protein